MRWIVACHRLFRPYDIIIICYESSVTAILTCMVSQALETLFPAQSGAGAGRTPDTCIAKRPVSVYNDYANKMGSVLSTPVLASCPLRARVMGRAAINISER